MINVAFSKLDESLKQKHNSILINNLKAIMTICDTHHLNYILSYGSCLGAVRHQGIIPWDDDIDICMPRPDYEAFIQICRNMDLGDYELYTPEDTPHYFEHYVRFGYKKSTMLFSIKRPCLMGIYIDIFPVDGILSVKQSQKSYFRFRLFNILLHRSFSNFTLSDQLKWLKKGNLINVLLSAIIGVNKSFWQRLCLHQIKIICNEYPYQTSDYVSCYVGDYYIKNIIPRKWIDETITVPFEGLNVKIPKMYEEYLTHYYGDWRQLPPEDKRDDRHIIDYLNLEKRASLEEIMSEIS